MSLSHLSTCGVGTCFDPDIEQLHVDGNKSLIFGMVNFSLKGQDQTFETMGRVGYLKNKGVIKAKRDRNVAPPKWTKFDPQDDIKNETLNTANDHTFQFKVRSPDRRTSSTTEGSRRALPV